MASQYIKYDDSIPADRVRAMRDVKNYLGTSKFKEICAAVHAEQGLTRKSFIMNLGMFAGIAGFPAEVFADELGLVEQPAPVVNVSAEIRTGLAESGCNTPPEA
jgi:hypothetical protein